MAISVNRLRLYSCFPDRFSFFQSIQYLKVEQSKSLYGSKRPIDPKILSVRKLVAPYCPFWSVGHADDFPSAFIRFPCFLNNSPNVLCNGDASRYPFLFSLRCYFMFFGLYFLWGNDRKRDLSQKMLLIQKSYNYIIKKSNYYECSNQATSFKLS